MVMLLLLLLSRSGHMKEMIKAQSAVLCGGLMMRVVGLAPRRAMNESDAPGWRSLCCGTRPGCIDLVAVIYCSGNVVLYDRVGVSRGRYLVVDRGGVVVIVVVVRRDGVFELCAP